MNMFTSNERHTVSRVVAVATAVAWLLLPSVDQSPAYGEPTNEKGPRCSDTVDNDGDGLIDCDDPDCKCGGDGGDGGGGTIAVTVTFQDLPGDGLMSDCHDCPTTCACLSAYIHKVDKVSTGIGSNGGNFFLKLTKGNQPAIRTLFLDFSDCDSPDECFPPFTEVFSVGPANMFTSGSGINLREMFVGEVREDLSLWLPFNLNDVGGGLWQLFFDSSNADCPGSSNITVRRIDTDTWEIEAGLTDVACLVKQAGGGVTEFSGLYHMPFKITVQKK